jgi:hypothetical protein
MFPTPLFHDIFRVWCASVVLACVVLAALLLSQVFA